MAHRVIDVFDRLAPQYDEVIPFFAAMAAQVASLLPLETGASVLDVAAGTGAVTGAALARGARVTAIDAAPAMVMRLRQRYPHVAAHVMDVHQLQLADSSFDIVVSSFAIHLLDDPDAALREIRRVLRPAGLFAFSTPGGPSEANQSRADGPDLWAEYSQYLPPGGGMGRPIDGLALLSGAGFIDVAARPLEVVLPIPGGGEMLWQWYLSHGTVAFIEDLPPERREQFRQRLIADADQTGVKTLRLSATLWSGRAPAQR
jgi:SAM-dependent methyltransferase